MLHSECRCGRWSLCLLARRRAEEEEAAAGPPPSPPCCGLIGGSATRAGEAKVSVSEDPGSAVSCCPSTTSTDNSHPYYEHRLSRRRL